MSTSYRNTWVFKTSAASNATDLSSLRAKSRRTSIEGPPFICDNSSKANDGFISSTLIFSKIISFRNLDFSWAAEVVPGIVL